MEESVFPLKVGTEMGITWLMQHQMGLIMGVDR